MGALIATIFTVITIAVSSIFVSNKLATRRSVSPNAPESKPAASSCKPCGDDEKGAGKDANGCYICVKINGSSNSAAEGKPNVASSSCSGPSSAALCINKNVGDTECVGGVILNCSRTSGLNCSAYDTKVPCGNSPVATSTLTPTPKPTATPTSNKIPTPTSSCACIGGYLVNCGAGSGAPCSVNIVPSSTPKPTITTDPEDTTGLLTEKKECQLSGGAWINNNCVYPTPTASLPKPSSTPKPTDSANAQISVTPTPKITPTPTKIIYPVTTPSPTKTCNVELLKTSACGANGCLSNQVQQTWKDVNCQIKNICQDSENCNKAVCNVGQYQCSGTVSVACLNGQFNGVKQNCGSLGCNSTTGKCNPTPTPIKTPTSTPLPDVHLGVSSIPSITPTVTPFPTPYCKFFKKIICGSLGCEETLDGGTCKYNTSSVLIIPITSFSPSISPTVTTIPFDDDHFLARERSLCKRDGGVWKNNHCQDPLKYVVTPSPTSTPTIIPLPDPKSLDSYKNSGDSQTFANTTDEIAGVIYSCQKRGNISGIALRNCFCDSIDCNTEAGQTISDSIFTYSSDGNGLQCVEFVSALETLQKNSSTSNCSRDGAQTGDEMAECAEPGYLRCDRGNGASFIEGDIVVWDGEPGHSEGHVAICVEVKNNGEDCVVAESNWNNDQTVGFRTIHSDGSDSYNHHSILRRTSSDNQSCY